MCCNDGRDGSPLGKSDTLEFDFGDGFEATFEGLTVVTRDDGDSHIKLGRLRIPYSAYKTWHGNWCWDAVRVSRFDAVRAVNYLLARGWRCTEGPQEIYEAKEVTMEDMEKWLNKGQDPCLT